MSRVAEVALFLASDDASYITGETIDPDGGRLALNSHRAGRRLSGRPAGGHVARIARASYLAGKRDEDVTGARATRAAWSGTWTDP